jgi:hypothetical protein
MDVGYKNGGGIFKHYENTTISKILFYQRTVSVYDLFFIIINSIN